MRLFLALGVITLMANPVFSVERNSFRLSGFDIQVDLFDIEAGSPSIQVFQHEVSDQPVWSTHSNQPLIEAARAEERVSYDRASFEIEDRVFGVCKQPNYLQLNQDQNALRISGEFTDCADVTFELMFSVSSQKQLSFQAKLSGNPDYNRIYLNYASEPDELFYGFGEQFVNFNLKGRRFPIWVEEQGHGRGKQPLTSLMKLIGAGGSAGTWYTTYSYVPYYVTNKSRSLYVRNYEYMVFDLEKKDRVRIEIFSNHIETTIIAGKDPLDIVNQFTNYTGRMQPLPEWTHQGVILRAFGGTEAVLKEVDEALEAGVALAGVWIEDWMGRRETLLGTRLWWNWEANKSVYEDWPGLVQSLRNRGIRVLIYFNPYLADVVDQQVDFERKYYREALSFNYLIKNPAGEPYTFGAGLFDGAIVDLSNPDARTFLKNLMQDQIAIGVSGWMADFGEAVPYDASLYSGEDPKTFHNKYPAEWAKLNREAIDESGAQGEVVTFHRSGNIKSPGYAPLFWTGDQLVTWDDNDGIKTVIPALTSSGLSGWSLSHSEVAGYLSINLGLLNYTRSKELFLRWPEISVFTAMLRTHSTIRPESNHQWNSDDETKRIFANYTQFFKALSPYRKVLMAEAALNGYPLIRHPILHYPDDPNVSTLTQQFMYGSNFWVAPVVDKGKRSVDVYLPAGDWVHLWSGNVYRSSGERYRVASTPGEPAVFFQKSLNFGYELREILVKQGVITE